MIKDIINIIKDSDKILNKDIIEILRDDYDLSEWDDLEILEEIKVARQKVNPQLRETRVVNYLKNKPKAEIKEIKSYLKRYHYDEVRISEIEFIYEDCKTEAFREMAQEKLSKMTYVEKKYAELASKLTRYPEIIDLENIGLTRAAFRETHGTIEDLRISSRKKFPSYFQYIYEKQHIDNAKINTWAKNIVQKAKTLVVTGITSGPICEKRLNSLLSYCKINKGVLCIIPMCKRVEDMDPRIIRLFLEKKLVLVVQDIPAHSNLILKYITQREATENPLSGMEAICKKSFIVGGATQRFKVIPMKKNSLPRAGMSTGVISMPFYRSSINHNKTPRNKSIVKAENNHFMSAWVIDKVNKDYFLPSQLMLLNDDGSFVDLGVRYYANGLVTSDKPITYVFGDTHGRYMNRKIVKQGHELGKKLGIKEYFYHDSFDGKSVGPHDLHKTAYLISLDINQNQTSLAEELKDYAEQLNEFTKYGHAYIVDSNHDDMLQRAFERGEILNNKNQNGFMASLLYTASILFSLKGRVKDLPKLLKEKFGIDPDAFCALFPAFKDGIPRTLEFAVSLFGLKNPDKITWLDKEDSVTRGGYQLAMHGHQGASGARGSLQGLYKSYMALVMGHTHSPEQRNRFLVCGHNQDLENDLRAHYFEGGTSSWLEADVIIYETGEAQHVFKIGGHIRKPSKKALSLIKDRK